MVYKVTTLKDLPGIPAGYSFCYEEGGRGKGPVIFFLNLTIQNPDIYPKETAAS